MGFDVIPLAIVLVGLFLSTSTTPPKDVAPFEVYQASAGLDVENVSSRNEDDTKVIYSYIRKKFKTVPTEDAKTISEALVEHGKTYQVDPKFTAALISRESGFNRKAVSSSGAKGLGQIKDFNFQALKIDDPYDIHQNTKGTTVYIKNLLQIWKDKSKKTALALASYFNGAGAVKKMDENTLDSKTREYVHGILSAYSEIKKNNSALEGKVNGSP